MESEEDEKDEEEWEGGGGRGDEGTSRGGMARHSIAGCGAVEGRIRRMRSIRMPRRGGQGRRGRKDKVEEEGGAGKWEWEKAGVRKAGRGGTAAGGQRAGGGEVVEETRRWRDQCISGRGCDLLSPECCHPVEREHTAHEGDEILT